MKECLDYVEDHSNADDPFMSKRCSDYEEDCIDVEEPFMCWLGMPFTFIPETGEYICVPVADGYCPLIKSFNIKE